MDSGVDGAPRAAHAPHRQANVPAAIVVGCLVGTLAFAAYTFTLLRSVDLGDTGAFQAAITSPNISARQAYPLYYALARPFVRFVAPDNPALGLNLFSAAAGGVAIAVFAVVVTVVTSSILSGAIAGFLFAFSYTWWHQADIAEVYTLHLLLVGICLMALWHYAERQTYVRLCVFFALYALAFGNHLSMILLLIPFAAFILMIADRPARVLRPSVIAAACAIALLGAMQYLPNLLALTNAVGAPPGLSQTISAFWFDVTKADWRQSMLLGVDESQLGDHLRMAAFDARQQFGVAGLAVAVFGLARLWSKRRAWAALLTSAYVINTAFATTYNVGDPHVFFLPGHYIAAFCAGAALMPLEPSRPRSGPSSSARQLLRARPTGWLLALAVFTYAGWRAYDTFPAADRHDDERGQQLVDQLTYRLDDQNDVLVADIDWQIENALLYASRVDRRDAAWIRLGDVLLHFPFFVQANHAWSRDVVVTAQAASHIQSTFGPFFPLAPEDPLLTLDGAAEVAPAGAIYVLAVLAPMRGLPIDATLTNGVLSLLTGKQLTALHGDVYEVIVGRVGERPALVRASARPFRDRVRIGETTMDVRMDGWLPTETFRRGGFGHIIRNHRHLMALERGVNLIWIGKTGEPSRPYYASGLYAPQSRYRIPANAPGLAQLR